MAELQTPQVLKCDVFRLGALTLSKPQKRQNMEQSNVQKHIRHPEASIHLWLYHVPGISPVCYPSNGSKMRSWLNHSSSSFSMFSSSSSSCSSTTTVNFLLCQTRFFFRRTRGDRWSNHYSISSPWRPCCIHLSVGCLLSRSASPCRFPFLSLFLHLSFIWFPRLLEVPRAPRSSARCSSACNCCPHTREYYKQCKTTAEWRLV